MRYARFIPWPEADAPADDWIRAYINYYGLMPKGQLEKIAELVRREKGVHAADSPEEEQRRRKIKALEHLGIEVWNA